MLGLDQLNASARVIVPAWSPELPAKPVDTTTLEPFNAEINEPVLITLLLLMGVKSGVVV